MAHLSLQLLGEQLAFLDFMLSLQYKQSPTHGYPSGTWLIDMLIVKASSIYQEAHGQVPLLHKKRQGWQLILCGSGLPWCLESSISSNVWTVGRPGWMGPWEHGHDEGPFRHPQGRRPVPHRHHHSGPTFPQVLTGSATLASEPVRPRGPIPGRPGAPRAVARSKSFPSSSRPPADLLPQFSFCSKHHHGDDQHHLFGCCSDFSWGLPPLTAVSFGFSLLIFLSASLHLGFSSSLLSSPVSSSTPFLVLTRRRLRLRLRLRLLSGLLSAVTAACHFAHRVSLFTLESSHIVTPPRRFRFLFAFRFSSSLCFSEPTLSPSVARQALFSVLVVSPHQSSRPSRASRPTRRAPKKTKQSSLFQSTLHLYLSSTPRDAPQ